jgi:hypothetical protein
MRNRWCDGRRLIETWLEDGSCRWYHDSAEPLDQLPNQPVQALFMHVVGTKYCTVPL